MYRAYIAVVDATRGRLFRFTRTNDETGLHEDLVEEASLVNPQRHERPSELFSASAGSGHVASHGFGLDDHRDQHLENVDRQFAQDVLEQVRLACSSQPVDRLILCAPPRMLGHLRHGSAGPVEVVEVAKDLTKLAPTALRAHLADHHALPPA